jgi:hypothetical protein
MPRRWGFHQGRRLAAQALALTAALTAALAAVQAMAPTFAGTASTAADGPQVEDRASDAGRSQVLGSDTYLPLVMRSAAVADLPLPVTSSPPAAATVTPTVAAAASPTQRASVTPPVIATATEVATTDPTSTATPPVCTASLKDRLRKVAVPIERPAAQPPPTPQNGFDVSRPILVSVRDDGTAYVGWSSTDQRVHVTPIRLNGQRLGKVGYGLRDLSQFEVGDTALAVCSGVLGIEGSSLGKVGNGQIQVPALMIGVATVVIGHGVLGVER